MNNESLEAQPTSPINDQWAAKRETPTQKSPKRAKIFAVILLLIGVFGLGAWWFQSLKALVVSTPKTSNGTKLYNVKSSGVYYVGDSTSRILLKADPGTFMYLRDGYAKDARHVFILEHVLENADPKTFEALGGYYAKDARHAYWALYLDDPIVPDADPKTFEYIGGVYAKDARHVYYYRLDYVVHGIVRDADPKTFQYLGSVYARDASHVFYAGVIIPSADPNTFQIVGASQNSFSATYAKDSSHVFRNENPVPNADPAKCISKNTLNCGR